MTKPRDLANLGGGFIQEGTGAVQRTTESKLQDVVSVKDFGAVGDGVADDTAAIQAAMDSQAGGGYVFFPEGNYLVTNPIIYKCSFGGQYGSSSDNANQTPIEGTRITYTGSGSAFVADEQYYGLTIENLTFYVNGSCQIILDIKYGGNFCLYSKLRFAASNTSSVSRAVFLRGIDPDTNISNAHQHSNRFVHIQIDGPIAIGIQAGESKDGDSIANANYFEHIIEYQSGASPITIKLNGYGSTIAHVVLALGCINFFDIGTENTILGGYNDSINLTPIKIDTTLGDPVVSIFGMLNITPSHIVDSVAPGGSRYRLVADQSVINQAASLGLHWQPSITSDYTATIVDPLLTVDASSGPVTITLPAVVDHRFIFVKKVDSSNNKVLFSGPSIDDTGSYALRYQNESVILHGTGTTYSAFAQPAAWKDTPFNAADFTGSGSMTWTVSSGNVITNQYKIDATTMSLNLVIISTTVGGTPDQALQFTLPGGVTPSKRLYIPVVFTDNGVYGTGFVDVRPSNPIIYFFRDWTGTNWSASANTSITCSISFSIN
jgi:hypothetical protein